MVETTPKRVIQQLIFGGDTTSKDSIEEDFEVQDEQRRHSDQPSAYVTVFEGIVRTVIENEHYLLSEQEINALENFSKLCYNSRYCLSRLVLRKSNTWHPLSSLDNFKREVTEDGLLSSISDLCTPITSLLKEETHEPAVKIEQVEVKKEETPEIIDLSMDTDDEDVKPVLTKTTFDQYWAKPSTSKPMTAHTASTTSDPLQAILDSKPGDMNLDYFCEDETKMTLEEILWRLTNVQLQEIVKRLKCKPKSSNKSDMVHAVQSHASTQSILNFKPTSKKDGKRRDDGMRQTMLPFQSTKKCTKTLNQNQQERLKEMALDILGKCIRVNYDFFRLVRRLHIIYYRETEHPTALLLPSLLTTFKKRNYTPYNTARSYGIWESRHDLLEYEKALEVESVLLETLNPSEKPGKGATKTPAPSRRKLTTPMTPRVGGSANTPLKTPSKSKDGPTEFPELDTPLSAKTKGFLGADFFDVEENEETTTTEVRKEETIKEYLDRYIFPIWQEHLVTRSAQEFNELPNKPAGLQRFETGYVYTRMMLKAISALGPLKEYKQGLRMIDHLLSQRFWSRGKRGRLYERKAIILGHLTRQADLTTDKQDLLYKTVESLKEALLDVDTGLVWRPGLMRRLIALEKRLKIPLEDRSQCAAELREANIVELIAVRVHGLVFDGLGRSVNGKENSPEVGLLAYVKSPTAKEVSEETVVAPPLKRQSGQKSKWEGRNGEIVDVETRALEYYEDQGFKGFHAETRILTTLFGLLFWDIIFADIPGAFETAFQSAPLDIFDDSFYYARKTFIDIRLNEIREGQGKEILRRHDDMYRRKKTWCLGVNWEFCTNEDLLEIVECMEPKSLATICILFCQDYRGRSSGGPDLFVWNPTTHACKFIEVKGPGDVARENQKLWFDALLRAGYDVDLCKVIDKNAKPPPSSVRKRKAKDSSSAVRPKKIAKLEDQSEDEDCDRLDADRDEDGKDPEFSSPSKRRRKSTVETNTLGG